MNPTAARSDEPNTLVFFALLVGSVAAHAVLMLSMNGHAPARLTRSPVEMAFFETKQPDVVKVEPPKPEIQRVKAKPVVVKREEAPPPPTMEAPKPTPVTPIAGLTPDSASLTGDVPLPIGNTTLFKASIVVDPRDVKPYAAQNYAPPGSADSEPAVLGEVKIEYPSDAKNNDIEGTVRLRVTTDERGAVTDVIVMSGPGYGLNEAAREALKRFKFKPAMKHGEAVGYTFTYSYRFELN